MKIETVGEQPSAQAAGLMTTGTVQANGRIIADSGEGYKSEQECLDDIKRVKGSTDEPVKKD